MLVFTIAWQLVLLVSVAFCELIFSDETAILDVAIALGSLVQLVQLIFVIVTSVKLVKQLRHRTASGWFLIQSYLSVVILYAGAFTLIYQIEPSSFHSEQLGDEGIAEIFSMYTIFLYFSGTTMSTGKQKLFIISFSSLNLYFAITIYSWLW